jgi:ferritin-like metal-binding protein YciE
VSKLRPALRDGFNASAAMGVEHYEIASYEAAIRLADVTGAEEVSALLRAVLDEEVETLQKLGKHATRLGSEAKKIRH